MMSGHIKMKEMTWTEYAGRKDGIVILPIGAITSFLGAPFFLVLLYRGYAR